MKSRIRNYFVWTLILFFFPQATFAQIISQKVELAGIIEKVNGNVGVAIMDLQTLDTLTFNDNHCYPMQSVYKFPLALAVLSEIDKGIFSLDQKIHLTKEDLRPNTWSPLREKYPSVNVEITLRELLDYTVAQSDNNGCDILFKLIGGPAKVNQYVKNLGINGMSIVATEKEMHENEAVQYKNCSTPSAMLNLLYQYTRSNILSIESKDFLWNAMVQNIFGSKRIIGELPDGTIVAHKTGTSGVNEKGIAAATNDVGIVTLPNEKHFAIVVFISDSSDNENMRDKIIADIAKVIWDAYLTNTE